MNTIIMDEGESIKIISRGKTVMGIHAYGDKTLIEVNKKVVMFQVATGPKYVKIEGSHPLLFDLV